MKYLNILLKSKRGGAVIHVGGPLILLVLIVIFVFISISSPEISKVIVGALKELFSVVH